MSTGRTWPDLIAESLKPEFKFVIFLLIAFLGGIFFTTTDWYKKNIKPLIKTEQLDSKPSNITVDKKAPILDLSGPWILKNTVRSAADSKYHEMQFEFKMHLDQSDDSITGKAVKYMENSILLPKIQQTSLDLHGNIWGDSIFINYTEKGKAGKFFWKYNSNLKRIEGHFASSVAVSRGESLAYRRYE